jgi:hypothetical protein
LQPGARFEAATAHPEISPPAAGHEQVVEPARILDQLFRRSALPRDHVWMIERRNHRERSLARDPLGDFLAHFLVLVVEHDLRAVAAGRVDLHRRRVRRHYDRHANAEHLPRKGNRLRVISRRIGEHPALSILGRQPRHRVIGAPELERAHPLEVLALEEHLRAGALVHGARSHHRRAMRVAGNPLGGVGDVGVADSEMAGARAFIPDSFTSSARNSTPL